MLAGGFRKRWRSVGKEKTVRRNQGAARKAFPRVKDGSGVEPSVYLFEAGRAVC